MNNKELIIFNNIDYNVNDYKEDYIQWKIDCGNENFDENNIDENDLYDFVDNTLSFDFDYVYNQLDFKTDLVMIADIGTWRGRFSGYKNINNLKYCMNSMDCDYIKVYVTDDDELSAEYSHHDGVNYAIVRAWKKKTSEKKKNEILNAIYNQEEYEDELNKHTKKVGKLVRALLDR